MMCPKCPDDKSLKFSPSQSNSKRETWVCTRKECDHREVYLLEQHKKEKEDWAA